MDNVYNRCLFSFPSKVEMAEEQGYHKKGFDMEKRENLGGNLQWLIGAIPKFTSYKFYSVVFFIP